MNLLSASIARVGITSSLFNITNTLTLPELFRSFTADTEIASATNWGEVMVLESRFGIAYISTISPRIKSTGKSVSSRVNGTNL